MRETGRLGEGVKGIAVNLRIWLRRDCLWLDSFATPKNMFFFSLIKLFVFFLYFLLYDKTCSFLFLDEKKGT